MKFASFIAAAADKIIAAVVATTVTATTATVVRVGVGGRKILGTAAAIGWFVVDCFISRCCCRRSLGAGEASFDFGSLLVAGLARHASV